MTTSITYHSHLTNTSKQLSSNYPINLIVALLTYFDVLTMLCAKGIRVKTELAIWTKVLFVYGNEGLLKSSSDNEFRFGYKMYKVDLVYNHFLCSTTLNRMDR